jgi:hypothetical protein
MSAKVPTHRNYQSPIEPGTPAAGAAPRSRPLQVYAFDPTMGQSLGNQMTIDVPFEKLRPGPIGRQVAVIDYDGSNNCYYKPVDLDDPPILLTGGLPPDESDPRFHQQMVYAVASETIRRFERALGRSIRWRFSRWRGGAKSGATSADSLDREQLRIFPHAMQEANAYYSRDLRALLFGYFPAVDLDAGANLPGQTVFTCLSHDIIAHETTHALVDSQRDFFMEPTSPDAPAFHEAFADIVALFQHFSFRGALLEMIQRTGGRIFRTEVDAEVQPARNGPTIVAELTTENPLVALAKQFGEAMGARKALRSALGTPPRPGLLNKTTEPHARGAILVAAVFDAFFSIYVRRTADLMRIARAAGAVSLVGDVHPDLAKRLADAAAKDAERFLNIGVRALDYCPPVDIRFGDFLRALVTSDYDLVPSDVAGYRAALIDAFRARGIVPEGAVSYSEEALRWDAPQQGLGRAGPRCGGLVFDVVATDHRERPSPAEKQRLKDQAARNARSLHEFAEANRKLLGMAPGVPIQARTFHTVHRVGPDGRVDFNVVAELMQRAQVPTDPQDASAGEFVFRGGATIILARDGTLRYAILKPLGRPGDSKGNERLRRQRAYLGTLGDSLALASYRTGAVGNVSMSLAAIHRGY